MVTTDDDPAVRIREHRDDLARRCPALLDFDPIEPEHLADPYAAWAVARECSPVLYVEKFGFWIVTSHELARQVLSDQENFTNTRSMEIYGDVPEELAERLPNGWPNAVPSFQNNDPPDHGVRRRALNAVLTAGLVARMEDWVRARAHELVDTFAAAGRTDIVGSFAKPFAASVVAELAGIPPERLPETQQMSHDLIALNLTMSTEEKIVIGTRLADYQDMVLDFVAQTREHPGEGLISRFANMEGESKPSDPEIVSMIMQSVAAGNDATAYSIGSMLLLLLSEYRNTWDELGRDRSRVPVVVEELLRLRAPTKGLFRNTSREVKIGDTTLPAGASVQVLYAAGNHDPSVFDEPRGMCPERENLNRTLTFGYGEHYCPGAALSRLEVRVALETILDRLPGFRLDEDADAVRNAPSVVMCGPDHLRVAWDPH